MRAKKRDPRVVIVGAGMSGIAMGVALKRAGFDDFVMLEKGSDVGGTWYWNHYPGLSCDVPSQLYQYSFHLKPDWERVFATQDEILDVPPRGRRPLRPSRITCDSTPR